MPPRTWKPRVEDILDAIVRIQRYTSGMTKDQFFADELVQDAVIRRFTVIGEAARHLPSEAQNLYPEVPWAKMRGMRNFVVHEYSGVDLHIVWNTIEDDLPPLVPMLRHVLEQEA